MRAAKSAGKTGNLELFKGQDFYKLRAELSAAGKLFEDPEFPAIESSLYIPKQRPPDIVWKRPGV